MWYDNTSCLLDCVEACQVEMLICDFVFSLLLGKYCLFVLSFD
jgi:hypothetical protein